MDEQVVLTEEQQSVFDSIIADEQSCFILVAAGVGKSTLLRELVRHYDGKCMVCAPTGVAALNVDGVTLHSAFGIPIRPLGPSEFSTRLPKKENGSPGRCHGPVH